MSCVSANEEIAYKLKNKSCHLGDTIIVTSKMILSIDIMKIVKEAIGLRSDGTVVADGNNSENQCDVDNWKGIVAIAASSSHTVGLKNDGTLVTCGWNAYGKSDVSDWIDIIAVVAGADQTIGLKADGAIVYAGDSNSSLSAVSR